MSATTTPSHPLVFSSLLAFSGPATLETIRKQKRKKSQNNVSPPVHISCEYHARKQFRDHPKANETLSMMLEEKYYDCCSIDESEQHQYEPQDDDETLDDFYSVCSEEDRSNPQRPRRSIFGANVFKKYFQKTITIANTKVLDISLEDDATTDTLPMDDVLSLDDQNSFSHPPAPTTATTSKESSEKCRSITLRRRIFSPAVASKYLIQIHQQVDDTSIFLDDETYTSFCLQDFDDDDSIGALKTHFNSRSMLATGTYY